VSKSDVKGEYRPSPRPEYDGPALIRREMAISHLWGDEESGRVQDRIYLSNMNLHALEFALQPKGYFVHSPAYRTIFGADEVMLVLEGELVLANPETGEVQKARKGEAIFFRKDTWHHGFNLGEAMLRVLEFFAPPPAQGTSGIYARSRPYLPREAWRYSTTAGYGTRPSGIEAGPARRTLMKVGEGDLLLELRGESPKALVGTIASTEYLCVGRIDVPAGFSLPAESHRGDEFLYLESGALSVFLANSGREERFDLAPQDGVYIPAGIKHEYHTPEGRPGRAFFGLAPM
jgi:quercetin dioxygenase-like cupin family protein